MRRFLFLVFVFVTGLSLFTGAALAEGTLLAFYSLNQTIADVTGNNGDANVTNAPFAEGGVYLNGKYVGTEPDGSMVQSGNVTELDFSGLSVKMEFKISEWPSYYMPVLFCGPSWRYMGATINTAGELYLNYNGYTGPTSTETVTPGVWHVLAMTHDGTTGRMFLDGDELVSQDFVPENGNDRRFVTHNGSNGSAFKGHVRNLAVYNGVVDFVADVVGDQTPGAAYALRNFPNPFNPATTITFDLPATSRTSLSVFDVSGRLVRMLVNEELLTNGAQERVWDGTDTSGRLMPSGTYFYRIAAGDFTKTKSMTLVK